MRHEISYRPTFAQLSVSLDRGEAVRAEAGAMLSHTAGIDIRTGTDGGLLGSLKRSVLGGESFFLNTFEAREPGTVTFAPRLPGDVIERDLGYEPLFVQSSSFLAGTPSVDLDTKFGGFRTFFAGEGLFLLRLAGPGSAFLSSFGAIDEVPLAAGERVVVDTGHVVAFESSVDYSVRQVGGLRSTLLSGEGLVVEFEGPGTVWTQSRSPDAFLDWIISHVPQGGAVVPVGGTGRGPSSAGGGVGVEPAMRGGRRPPDRVRPGRKAEPTAGSRDAGRRSAAGPRSKSRGAEAADAADRAAQVAGTRPMGVGVEVAVAVRIAAVPRAAAGKPVVAAGPAKVAVPPRRGAPAGSGPDAPRFRATEEPSRTSRRRPRPVPRGDGDGDLRR